MKTTMVYTAPIFGYYSIKCMSETAKILGKENDYKYFLDLSHKIADAIGRGLINSDGNMSVEYMGAYVLLIYFDLVPEKHKQYFADKLISLIEDNGNCLDTGFLATPYLLDTLCKIGRKDNAYELLYQEKCPWLHQVNSGATTIWESWYGYKKMSHAH